MGQDTWLQALIRSRIREGKALRRPRAIMRFPSAKWIYPWAYERQYGASIQAFLRALYNPAIKDIRESWPHWVGGHKDSLHQDETWKTWSEIRATMKQQKVLFMKGGMARAIHVTGKGVDEVNGREWQKFVKSVGGQQFYVPEDFSKKIATWEDLNFELVDSLGDELIKKMNTVVSTGIMDGTRWEDIADKLSLEGLEKGRADFIARDQTGKLNGVLTKDRQTDAGVDEYEWDTSMDEKVRDEHQTLQGRICSWDDPSVYKDSDDEDWKPREADMFVGNPGDDYQCRCVALPHFTNMWNKIQEEEDGAEQA